jgi:RHS repeat-associated protein
MKPSPIQEIFFLPKLRDEKKKYLNVYTLLPNNIVILESRKGMQGRHEIFEKGCAVTYINEYYSYGLQNQQTSSTQYGSKEQRYKFGSKELIKDFKLEQEDFGARLYSPQIGRWGVLDPMTGSFMAYSPYNYTTNNPVNFIDPNGEFTLSVTGEQMIQAGITDNASMLKLLNVLCEVADNLEQLAESNGDMVGGISQITGQSVNQVKSDFKSGNGPTVNLENIAPAQEQQNPKANTMTLDIKPFAELAKGNANNAKGKEEYNVQMYAAMIYVSHEYGHFGDKKTNGGHNSGQGFNSNGDLAKSSVSKNRQIPISQSEHRGVDVEQLILYGNIIELPRGSTSQEVYKRKSTSLYDESGAKLTPQMRNAIKNSDRYKKFNK